MSATARAMIVLGTATTAAAWLPLAWGLLGLGAAGGALALVLPDEGRARLRPVMLALLAVGAVGGAMMLAEA